MTKNRKIFDTLKDAGFTESDVLGFCEKYLELVLESYTKEGISPTKLAEKMLKNKLIYRSPDGKIYVES